MGAGSWRCLAHVLRQHTGSNADDLHRDDVLGPGGREPENAAGAPPYLQIDTFEG